MTISQLQTKLNIAANEKIHSECAKLCREILVASIDYIYENAHVEKQKGASLLELIDGPIVTAYVNDADMVKSLHYILAKEHYLTLDKTAQDCIHCGHCTKRCPFSVDQMQRMDEIKAYFGK